MYDQQRLRPACAYAQSDQSHCSSLEYSISVKLLTEHVLEVLILKGGCTCNCQNAILVEITCHGSIIKCRLERNSRLHNNSSGLLLNLVSDSAFNELKQLYCHVLNILCQFMCFV